MAAIWRWFRIGLRLLCYLNLIALIAAFAAMAILQQDGLCSRIDEGMVQCSTPFYENIAMFSIAFVLATAFTGIPGFLALAGAIFLFRDAWHLIFRRRKTA